MKIFYGGNIITMDEKNPLAEAVAVKEGKILAVGTYEEVMNFQEGDAELIDLNGKTMMPGFIEPHCHPEVSSIMYDWVDVSGFNNDSKEAVFNRIKEAVKNTPKGEWIPCFGYDSILLRDLTALKSKDLDELSTDHPIMINIQSMHTTYVNSKALEVVGINKDTPDPKGGKYLRYEDGTPNGIVVEQNAFFPFFINYLSKLKKTPQQLLQAQYKRFRKVGVTTTWAAGYMPMFPNFMQTMKEEIEKDTCPIRLDYAISFNQIESGALKIEDLQEDSDKNKFTGFKFWYDGSPYTGNMFLEENYVNSKLMQEILEIPKDQAGERLFEQDVFTQLLTKYHNEGKQLSIHCQGDRAAREILDCLEKVITENPRNDHRYRLEHCALMPEKEIERAAKLGVTLSFHSNHIRFYGEALNEDIIGPERSSKLMSANTALKYGHTISFHTDAPMYPTNPLEVARTAVTRSSRAGLILGADEAISVHEALKGITISAAWQLFREHEIGSIEVGKFADFTVLAQNPYEVNPKDLNNIEIVTTYLAGNDTAK